MRISRVLLSLVMIALLVLAGSPGRADQPLYPQATVSIDLTGIAAGVGYSWGSGVLRYQGKSYHFSVQGISVGNVGISTVSAVGNVYNLNNMADFPGNYMAVGAGISLAGGVAGLTMQNQRKVLIDLYAVQQGVQLNIGPQGFTITMD